MEAEGRVSSVQCLYYGTSPGQVNNQQRARRRGTTMIACCESSQQRAGGVAVSLRNIPEDKVGLLLLLLCWGGLPGNTQQSTAWKHETSPSARRWPCSPVMTRGGIIAGQHGFLGWQGSLIRNHDPPRPRDCHVRSAQTALYGGSLTQPACLCVQIYLLLPILYGTLARETEPSAKHISGPAPPAPVTGKECRHGRMPDKEGREHSSRVQGADARLPVEVPGVQAGR
jgi:hypothetical protein